MISLDWKERLNLDTDDFFEKKIPNNDFDIELIYNSYPLRVEGKVPKAVVSLVAKNLATKLSKKPKSYINFYTHLWEKDDENLYLAYSEIISKALKKEPDFFWNFIIEKLKLSNNILAWQAVVEKSLYPFLKKDATDFLKDIFTLFKEKNAEIKNELTKLLIKLIKNKAIDLKQVYEFYQSSWLTASPSEQIASVTFLKAMYKIDSEFYKKVYSSYKNTREPAFAEVLTAALCCYTPDIEHAVLEWEKSGNIRLKKAGKLGVKTMKRYKKKLKGI